MASQFEIDKQNMAEANQVMKNISALNRWLTRYHPEIRICIGTENAFTDYFGDRLFAPLNEEDFAFALGRLSSLSQYARQHVSTPAEKRAALIDEICDLLRAPDPSGKGGRYSSSDLRNEKIKMASWSRETLQARISELLSKQVQNKMSVPQLRQVVRDAARDTRRCPGYPNLPEMIVPPGQVKAVRCDSAYLLNLARSDFYEYKRMCARYSTAQISDRQQGKS